MKRPASIEQAMKALELQIIPTARAILEQTEDGDFPPAFFIFTEDEDYHFPMEWGSVEEKEFAARVMRLLAIEAQPHGL